MRIATNHASPGNAIGRCPQFKSPKAYLNLYTAVHGKAYPNFASTSSKAGGHINWANPWLLPSLNRKISHMDEWHWDLTPSDTNPIEGSHAQDNKGNSTNRMLLEGILLAKKLDIETARIILATLEHGVLENSNNSLQATFQRNPTGMRVPEKNKVNSRISRSLTQSQPAAGISAPDQDQDVGSVRCLATARNTHVTPRKLLSRLVLTPRRDVLAHRADFVAVAGREVKQSGGNRAPTLGQAMDWGPELCSGDVGHGDTIMANNQGQIMTWDMVLQSCLGQDAGGSAQGADVYGEQRDRRTQGELNGFELRIEHPYC
ncbi:hypothetical protein B0H14DRAFT_2572448 [Mycena olivaceomarginata]|nr:hypothetical protein B0H14DRAFT_2572448 [Mycena olivaceomarginata]